ncbi:CCR4-NOT transcription complex subunit 7-like [Teleopsis dalmanni]|uniref:CCR4-NOT transcription complex subunit 7-like n=1 Tax=Teleopsis dalmanni TaxID=139649 RepID=UPI0018CF9D6C|nr:CCR4-NOT transcription complex subunit 7-like [Teleopsis dalmanni]XP_037954126.1 CCR4-NOT transcription complex subunit 7-like [Teleopsis dalmanni]
MQFLELASIMMSEFSSSSFANSKEIPIINYKKSPLIREVWRYNLEDEFRKIRKVVQTYPVIALDTEFPGIVARPLGGRSGDFHYQQLRVNVNLLNIIQIGFAFMDENGKQPADYSTWQFNFKFSLRSDMYAVNSIELLQNAGIKFKQHEIDGIDPTDFAELLMMSGVVLMKNVKFVSFHSGYDFGYLIRLLTNTTLPAEERQFFETLRLYFPTIYDIKYLMKNISTLRGGLQELADQLDLHRIGPRHQAGSDALLTGMVFFKMCVLYKEIKNMQFEPTSVYLDYHYEISHPAVCWQSE